MVKTTSDPLEGPACAFLGPDVCPSLLRLSDGGYSMESLDQVESSPGLLREIEELLSSKVWPRAAVDMFSERSLEKKFGARMPYEPEEFCLIHGDPTVSNALRRGSSLVLCDPTWRSYVPSVREVDMGKILQSAAGWETVAYGDPTVEWLEPEFWSTHRERALLWLRVHAWRITWRNPTDRLILSWCDFVRRLTCA